MTTFELRSAAGVIPLASGPGESSPWSLLQGTRGLGLAPTSAVFRDAATTGGSLVSTRVGMREPLLRIDVSGSTGQELADNLAFLQSVVRSRRPIPAVPDAVWARRSSPLALVASGSPSTDGDVWLMLDFVDGGPDAYDDGGELSVTWDLSVRATWPYWQSVTAVEVTGLTGDVTGAITNPGDVPVPLAVTIAASEFPLPADSTFVFESDGVEVGRFTVLSPVNGWRVLEPSDTGWTFYAPGSSTNRYGELGPELVLPVAPPGGSIDLHVFPGGGTWGGEVRLALTPMIEVVR